MNCYSTDAKKQLYIVLVRSHLLYCSQLWNPCLIKDIINMERIQRRSTKYILNDYTSDYKTLLLKLKLLPLMYLLDLSDVLFFIKSIKLPSDNFNILHFVSFSSSNTRSSSHNKLNHKYSRSNKIRYSYFVRLPRLWNSLPPIDLNQSFSSIKTYIYRNILKLILTSSILAHFTIHVLVLTATREIKQLILSSQQIQINMNLSIVDRLSYIILGCWHGLPSDPQYLL